MLIQILWSPSMSLPEMFAENRHFVIPTKDGCVDEIAIDNFIKQYGPDVAKGYMMALSDVYPQIETIRLSPGNAQKRKLIHKLLNYIEGVLHLVSVGNNQSNSNTNLPSTEPK